MTPTIAALRICRGSSKRSMLAGIPYLDQIDRLSPGHAMSGLDEVRETAQVVPSRPGFCFLKRGRRAQCHPLGKHPVRATVHR